ncbi:methylenetetrahydrofolate reductase [Striga asiatica]|uniref:Methylenetetrahydrofolate reductase n=1 Tax=Striga asiatica TaxID=4170 RepID=A0A5A7Q856_STRAF|nr:methylenetetrahydrofolate reductase [Striga asiatica]
MGISFQTKKAAIDETIGGPAKGEGENDECCSACLRMGQVPQVQCVNKKGQTNINPSGRGGALAGMWGSASAKEKLTTKILKETQFSVWGNRAYPKIGALSNRERNGIGAKPGYGSRLREEARRWKRGASFD